MKEMMRLLDLSYLSFYGRRPLFDLSTGGTSCEDIIGDRYQPVVKIKQTLNLCPFKCPFDHSFLFFLFLCVWRNPSYGSNN